VQRSAMHCKSGTSSIILDDERLKEIAAKGFRSICFRKNVYLGTKRTADGVPSLKSTRTIYMNLKCDLCVRVCLQQCFVCFSSLVRSFIKKDRVFGSYFLATAGSA
jgi:hypothetical protein